MNCSELIASFTDYIDGSAPSHEVRAMEEHLLGCDSCRRYKAVLEHGSTLLQSLPSEELREDFAPRLQHRLYHVQEERSLAVCTEGETHEPLPSLSTHAILMWSVA